jgi:formamidopyrimidine-DNA glycosylase
MPESPEVQILAEDLDRALTGRRIQGIDLIEARVWKTRERPAEGIAGCRITGVSRYGKHVDLEIDRGSLVVSFGRAGWARLRAPELASAAMDPDAPPVVAAISFDDGSALELTDAGEWLSLGLSWVDEPLQVPAIAKLGPDPMGPAYTREDFARAVDGRRKRLKALLVEQESFSGVGNAYSDEILHTARLSPFTHAAALTDEEKDRLFATVRAVLIDATAARRDTPPEELKAAKVAAMRVHGRAGGLCGVCGSTILDVPGTSQGAQYCPGCQTGGVPLPE